MADTTRNSLRAERIAQLQREIETTRSARDHAEAAVANALTQTTTPQDRERVESEREAHRQAAQARIEFAGKEIDRLLGEEKKDWPAWIGWMTGIASLVLIIGLAAFTAVVIAVVLLGGSTLLAELAEATAARGLITFLIAIITVAIAVLIVLSTIFSTHPDRKERFEHGKEILALLIGVLGTIVGFYFGQAASEGASFRANGTLTSGPVVANEQETVTASVEGGSAPFIYVLTFPGHPDLQPVAVNSSERSVAISFKPLPGASGQRSFVISASDAKGHHAESSPQNFEIVAPGASVPAPLPNLPVPARNLLAPPASAPEPSGEAAPQPAGDT